jgi:hypothetical protein
LHVQLARVVLVVAVEGTGKTAVLAALRPDERATLDGVLHRTLGSELPAAGVHLLAMATRLAGRVLAGADPMEVFRGLLGMTSLTDHGRTVPHVLLVLQGSRFGK